MLLKSLSPKHLPEATLKKGVLAVQREVILQTLLNVLLGLYTIGFAGILLFSAQVIRSGMAWVYLLVYLGVVAITIIRKIHYYARASVIVLVLQALGAAALLSYGLSGTGLIFLFASALIALLLFPPRIGVFFILTALMIIGAIGGAMVAGRITLPPVEVLANSGNPAQWGVASLVMLFTISITASSLYAILREMSTSLLEQEQLTQKLEIEQDSLEQRVQERSADLKKRVEQFEIASQVARDISSETSLERLLSGAVNQIRDRFGFYHVGVFVNDERGEYTLLQAATGEAGRLMLERGHRLKIGEIGIVGYVAGRGEARIASNVSGDAVHYKNPILPDTRSEMALPLRTGDRTIGALDVQSVAENAFTQEDTRILQIIADQLAIALIKTQQVQALRQSVEEMETNAQVTTQKAWRTHLRNTHQKAAYHYHNASLDSQVEPSDQANEALARGQAVLRTNEIDEQGRPITVLAVPIKLRNQVLGVVDIRFASANVSRDLIALIEGTVSRLAVSLENARLLEEIQLHAERERLVGEISSKVRAAPDVDSVLRIAIQEIGQSLGVSEVMVQLKKDA